MSIRSVLSRRFARPARLNEENQMEPLRLRAQDVFTTNGRSLEQVAASGGGSQNAFEFTIPPHETFALLEHGLVPEDRKAGYMAWVYVYDMAQEQSGLYFMRLLMGQTTIDIVQGDWINIWADPSYQLGLHNSEENPVACVLHHLSF